MVCIGLFGTCGDSTWRESFIRDYDLDEVTYFNPQLEPGKWKPEFAEVEAEHLADDEIILFPITSETYAMGSLAETGFSILQAIRLDDRRDFVIMIDKDLDQELKDTNPTMAIESLRARALVLQHLKKLRLSNLYVVDSLNQMLEVSLTLYKAHQLTFDLKRFNLHRENK